MKPGKLYEILKWLSSLWTNFETSNAAEEHVWVEVGWAEADHLSLCLPQPLPLTPIVHLHPHLHPHPHLHLHFYLPLYLHLCLAQTLPLLTRLCTV